MKTETDEKEPLKKKRKSTEARKLRRAVSTLASIVDCMALSMKTEQDNGGLCDIKQLKELCSTAKELSALMGTLEDAQASDTRDPSHTFTVHFEGEGEKWAK